jgi:AcrR family transcriptional regulator
MLKQVLQRIIDQKWSSAREMAEVAGVSPSTVYRWIAGQTQPEFDAIRQLMRHLPDARAQEALLDLFTTGTDWTSTKVGLVLDINADGRIDHDDALDAACQAVHASAESLARLRLQTRQGQPLDAETTLSLMTQLHHAVKHCTITQRILLEVAEQRKKRKLKIAE